MKKRVFIASSVEGLDVAYSIQENLDYDFEVTTWPQGVFELSKVTIETLITKAKESDAAVFIFTPDDDVIVRGESKGKVRDNVVFELGLFIGVLGLESCFVVKPRSFCELNLPTDLLGLSVADYEDKRTDKNLVAALGPAAYKIKRILTPNITTRTEQKSDLFEILTSAPLNLFLILNLNNQSVLFFRKTVLLQKVIIKMSIDGKLSVIN
ncbi:nucleotide-binding protein [Pseudoalteromonas sp. Hal040]|uniref:nucleotide-binding protein n=1 Tax=unclassified Pseudoalteromonas TaxID=194690 RepID=UPI00301CEB43